MCRTFWTVALPPRNPELTCPPHSSRNAHQEILGNSMGMPSGKASTPIFEELNFPILMHQMRLLLLFIRERKRKVCRHFSKSKFLTELGKKYARKIILRTQSFFCLGARDDLGDKKFITINPNACITL